MKELKLYNADGIEIPLSIASPKSEIDFFESILGRECKYDEIITGDCYLKMSSLFIEIYDPFNSNVQKIEARYKIISSSTYQNVYNEFYN